MNKKLFAVYREGIPDEIIQLFGLNNHNALLEIKPVVKIRVRREAHGDAQHVMKIFPLLGPRIDLMGLKIRPEIEIVFGD